MDEHDYDERNIHTCKKCKQLFDKYGPTDAQLISPHKPRTIYDYTIPGTDIHNANEFGNSDCNVRIKKEYSNSNVAAPTSQINAFEFYGGDIHKK